MSQGEALVLEIPSVTREISKNISVKCAICDKAFTSYKTLSSYGKIKPRFLKLVQNQYQHKIFKNQDWICKDHISTVLQSRIDELVIEDQNQFSKLQEDAMRNLEKYEIEERTWQDQFESGRSLGERTADNVAKFGGSWMFIFCMVGVLVSWMGLNGILGAFGGEKYPPWDPYPYILLNLILSMLAATQAPVIMMSQNRQAERDRKQNDFVARAILRNEHQTRHVDAKLDHLLTYQWKRLLEIQEIQTQMFETHFEKRKKKYSDVALPIKNEQDVWTCETTNDPLTNLLLKYYLKVPDQEPFIFSHWHEDGDNYKGDIEKVALEFDDGDITLVSFKLRFDIKATLDDIFSGEGHVFLRNDFNLPYMSPKGHFASFHLPIGQYEFINNGDLPPRYKPVFSRLRHDRITDLWKAHLNWIELEYLPPKQIARVNVPEGKRMSLTITMYADSNSQTMFRIYQSTVQKSEREIAEAIITRPLPTDWTCVAVHSFEDAEPRLTRKSSLRSESSLKLVLGKTATMALNLEPGCYSFICDDGRVGYHGIFEDV